MAVIVVFQGDPFILGSCGESFRARGAKITGKCAPFDIADGQAGTDTSSAVTSVP